MPVAASNYAALALDGERLYLLDRDSAPDAKPQLKTLAISADAPQPEVFLADVQSFALSADAKKLLLVKVGSDPAAPQAPGEMLIVDAGAKAAAASSKAQVRVADWNLAIDPAAEWRQMFTTPGACTASSRSTRRCAGRTGTRCARAMRRCWRGSTTARSSTTCWRR